MKITSRLMACEGTVTYKTQLPEEMTRVSLWSIEV